jgi:hypothetical protein
MTDIDTIRRDIATLAEMRAKAERADVLVNTAQTALDDTDEAKALAALKEQRATDRKLLAEMEATIKDEAVDYFVATGERKPVPGVTIKMFRVAFYDKDAAETWIRASAPALLVPDWKAFVKTAAELGGPITWKDDPQAQIASVL